MKNKIFYLIVTLFVFQSIVSAKSPGDLSATLKDSKTKEPIAFASVELLNTRDSLLAGCITDSKGYFEFTPPVSTAKIRFRFLGYKNLEMDFKDKDLHVLYLEEEAKSLNEVNVTGSNKVNKIDRDVFAITKELRAGTTSSQELLGKLSGVQFNQYDKSISVNGNTNILILVDGIEKDQNFAKNLLPERIERVEVIKDPIGKYATDGYAAVINIILRKDFTGIDITVSNTAFFDIVGTNNKEIFAQDYGNFNLNYSYKKLNIYSNGSIYAGNFNMPIEYSKQYGDKLSNTLPMNVLKPNLSVNPLNSNFAVGADYTFNKKHTVSTELKYSSNNDKQSSFFSLINSTNGNVTGTSTSKNITENNTVNLQAGVTYKGIYDEKNSIIADFRYNRTDGFNYKYYQQDNFTSENNIDLSGDYLRMNINYSHIFSSKLNIEAGYGNVYFTNTNTLQNNSFTRYNYRNRASLYLSYRPFEKLNTKLGGIVENYTQKYGDESKNLTVILPYANVQYKFNKNFNIVARYQANAQYTTINQLNPFRMAEDSLMYSVGNPALKTGISNRLGLDLNLFNVITLSPYYTFNKSSINSYIDKDPANNQLYLKQNVNADLMQSYGVRLNFTVPFGKQFFWQNYLGWTRKTIEYNQEFNSANNLSINTNLIYVNQPKGMLAGLIYQKQLTRNIEIQSYGTSGNDIALLMLRKSFLNQKLNTTLFYALPVDLGLKYDLPGQSVADGYQQTNMARMHFIKNLIFIEVSYNLSAGKKTKKFESASDDELNGAKRSGFGL